jgi:hypothetical protein
MNTIAPAPVIKKLPPGKRVVGVFIGLLGGAVVNASFGYSAFSLWSRKTTFVPYDTSSPDLATATFKKHNPNGNPPACIDHAIRTVPLSQLKTTDQKELTRDFCRGVWSGIGFAYQRRFLEKKYKALPGRENHLWSREELGKAEYDVGTKITDHFEVVEKSPEKVCLQCGQLRILGQLISCQSEILIVSCTDHRPMRRFSARIRTQT